MLFNSWAFLIFLILVLGGYLCLKHKGQNILLLVASYLFYGWWDWRFLSLLLVSTIVDFHCAQGMTKNPKRKEFFLSVSLATNLGILGFFKYFNFFAHSAEKLLNILGFEADYFTLSIILPVGISFYTFQTLAYSIDVFRGKEKATKNWLAFAIYVAYFPQLVAGPIERSTNLLPKIQKPRNITPSHIYNAAPLILMGYFMKVFVADGVAPIVNRCFNHPEDYGGIALLLGVYLFALQIYGDFAGYTHIARGISRLFGIELCLNFKQPYLAPNITEFWRRWHISLSSWLRDYLYIPLGGNRKGEVRTYINNMLTMLLGGLWHGAGWNFVIWGGLHGAYLGIHKFSSKGKKARLSSVEDLKKSPISWFLNVFLTFNLVGLSWIFFRSDSGTDAINYLMSMFNNSLLLGFEMPLLYFGFYGFFICLLDFICFINDIETPFAINLPSALKGLVYAGMVFLLLIVGENNAQPFIYFQF